jgi:hypothetical protein
MDVALQTSRHAVEIPLAVRRDFEKFKGKWSPYGPPIQVTQETVDAFTALTGDDNPIHRASAQFPCVPGFLTLALMPKLFGRELPMQAPGRRLLIAELTPRFGRLLPVSALIKMRYKGITLLSDRMNVKAVFDFEIARVDTKKNVVEGQIQLCLA